MKTLYTLIFAIFALTASAQQDPLHYENFQNGAYSVILNQHWATNVVVLPSNQSSTVDRNHLMTSSASGSSVTYLLFKPGFTNIHVNWLQYSSSGTFTFEYSIDGTNFFSNASVTQQAYSYNSWSKYTAVLPATVDGVDYVTIRVTLTPANGNSSNVMRFDELSITGVNTAAVLPVELSSFKVQEINQKTKIIWSTATEQNNEKFVVERSLGGRNFEVIGEVKGNGNSSIKRSYTFTDDSPSEGINYYRLRQIDTDGTEAFSNIVALQFAGLEFTATVYPTVATSTVNISLQNASSYATINVVDITGRTVATYSNTSLREIEVPVQNFKSGMYFVRVTDGQSQQVQRFLKE